MDSGGEVKGIVAGPWHRNIPPATRYPTVWWGRNTHVAVLARGLPPEEAEAVIDLIAAAPELLAALKALLLHNCVVDPTYGMKDAEDLYAESCALEAIAKATGSTRDGAPPQSPLKAMERGG